MAEPAAVERSKRPSEAEQGAPTRSRPRHSMPRRRESSSARRRPPTRTFEEHVPPDAEDDGKGKRDGKKRGRAGNEETEVDRILLAKEFAGLLQVPTEDDEGSR